MNASLTELVKTPCYWSNLESSFTKILKLSTERSVWQSTKFNIFLKSSHIFDCSFCLWQSHLLAEAYRRRIGVHTARFLKYVWPFYNIMHERVKIFYFFYYLFWIFNNKIAHRSSLRDGFPSCLSWIIILSNYKSEKLSTGEQISHIVQVFPLLVLNNLVLAQVNFGMVISFLENKISKTTEF